MRKAILGHAYYWICESCGAMNHVHPVIETLSEEQRAAFAEFLEIDANEPVEALRHPSIVVCPLCKESFETELEELDFEPPETT